jgi:hypothetical protein
MPSPSSSISSSSARGFALAAVAAGLCAYLAAGALGFMAVREGLTGLGFDELIAHQRAKIARLAGGETIFLGDSSLGNAIDVAAWSDDGRAPAVKLPLTGFFGFEADANLLRQVLARAKPGRVIIVHNALQLQVRFSHLGAIATASSAADYLAAPPAELLQLFFSHETVAAGFKRMQQRLRGKTDFASRIVDDYVAQQPTRLTGPALAKAAAEFDLSPATIVADYRRGLARLAALCRDAGIECLYVHGTLYKGLCARALGFLAAAGRMIVEAGLAVVAATPVCLEEEEVGDTVHHAAPDLKRAMTVRYRRLIDAHLAGRGTR